MQVTRTATLVAIEFGASWPRWLDVGKPGLGADGAAAGASCIVTVAQHYEGVPSSLVTQVASRITRMEQAGWQLGNVVLACNGRSDADALTARSVLARGLLEHLRNRAHRAGAEFVLALGQAHDARAVQALAKLRATLAPPPHAGQSVRVSVRLGQDQPLHAGKPAPSSSAAA